MITPGEAPDTVEGLTALPTPDLEAVLRTEEQVLEKLDASSRLRRKMQSLSDDYASADRTAAEAQLRLEESQTALYRGLVAALEGRSFQLDEPELRLAFYRIEDQYLRFKTPSYLENPSDMVFQATVFRPYEDGPIGGFRLTTSIDDQRYYSDELQDKQRLLNWILSGALRLVDADETVNPTP